MKPRLKVVRTADTATPYGDEALRLATGFTLEGLVVERRDVEAEFAYERKHVVRKKKQFAFGSLVAALILMAVTLAATPRSLMLIVYAICAISVLALWYAWIDNIDVALTNQSLFAAAAFELARGIRAAIDAAATEAVGESQAVPTQAEPAVVILPPPIPVGTPPTSDRS